MRKPRITVVGSFVVGLTIRLPRLPVPGESLFGDEYDLGPGGKGSNQAIAAARLRAVVAADVAILTVTVVTFLHAILHMTITTGRRLAGGQARIAVDVVAIIAGFVALFVGVQIASTNAVTATGQVPRIGAGIRIDAVAIVAAVV